MTTDDRSDAPRTGDVLDRNLTTLLGQAGDPATIAPAARARIRAGLIAQASARAPRSRFVVVGWGLAATAAAAVVVATIAGGDGADRGRAAEQGVAARAPAAASSTITLADGSTAELGEGGVVRELGPRRVRVEGTVFLDVVPGQGTFTVDTGHGQLSVLGTRFVVEATRDATTAAVLRGAVAMRSAGREEVIRAGEEGTMTTRTAPVRRPAPRLSHLVSWVAERRKRDERPPALPARSGVLVARNPMWQEQEFPLPLRALTVDVHLENQVARVALDQTFHNPQPQQLEGVYKFSLPPDAAVARLAMYVDGRLTESAVVERMRARRIYEDIVYQRRDPALLEQMGASKVSLRIFPLFPQQDRRVILAYTQPLARTYDDVTLTVPLPDLEAPVADVELRVKVVGCGGCELASPSHAITVEREGADARVSYRAKGERLGDSLILRMRQPAAPAATAASTIADGRRYLLLRARPELGEATAPADRPHRWVLLHDTSASRGAVERRAQAELIGRLVDAIDETDDVTVVAFDATRRRFGDWQDAVAIDRRKLGSFLAADGGLGETDLAGALAEARRLLAGEPGYVVYVGDGTATGSERTIDQLRDALANSRATFIGLGVGDGVDLPTLDALADATGGLAAHVDLGDDLAWRALDVVAALYTPRLTGLVASVEADGDPADAAEVSAYLRSRQVAAGEDVEVVVRAPARTDVDAIVLRGELAGRPWERRFALADVARAAGDAGYLPRLWGERRLDALVTAGDRALAPCTTTPCASDEERAVAAYHARKAEMVALGKEHFLLSPHTSLIVLENDAMYRQYGVEKGSGATWAPYEVPAVIAAVSQSTDAPVVDDGTVWRQPLGDLLAPSTRSREAGGAPKEFEASAFALTNTLGLGKKGLATGGGGTGDATGDSGTGQGYGRVSATSQPAPVTATPTPDVAQPVGGAAPADAKLDADAAASADPGPLSGADFNRQQERKDNDWSNLEPIEEEDAAAGVLGATLGVRAQRSDRMAFDALDDGLRSDLHGGLVAGPLAYLSSGDHRLDDLTGWLPGLSRTVYDDLAEQLEQRAGGERGSITDDARRALTGARAALRPGRWRWAGDAEVVVDRDGRLQRSRTLDTGAREVVTYDGRTLTVSYPELAIAATRAVDDREPALLSTLVPLVPPRPEHLARWYDVTLSGTRTIVLVPAGGGAATELELAADGTIAAVRRVVDGARTTVMTVARAGGGYQVELGGRTVRVGYTADDGVRVSAAPAADVSLELPLRADGHWRRALDGVAAGSASWRVLQHQRAAAALATGQVGVVAAVARELLKAGTPLTTGERVLVGGGLAWLDPASRAALADGGGAVGEYLAASAIRMNGGGRGASSLTFGVVAARSDGLIATLAAHRALLQAIEAGQYRAAREAFDRVLDRHPSETLALLAARRLAQAFYWREPEAVGALDRVATGRWRNLARAEAAQLAGHLRNSGRSARPDAGDRWVALLEDVDLSAPPPVVDHGARAAVLASARGEVGWNLAMSAWRQRALASSDLDHVLAFARAAATGRSDDLDAALDRALALAGDDDGALTAVVTLAGAAGRRDRARALLATARVRRPDSPALTRMASQAAEQAGEPTEAARLLLEAMKAEGDRPVKLSVLRAEYGRLIRLYGAAARSASGSARDEAVAAALAAGRDWRALDPDLAARERQLGELLLAVDQDDEAWRYLSTPIDLAPREGTSFQAAAEVLEREGELDRALALWRRAFAIDATNPTWLQRAAQVELALGRTDDARATLDRIASRRWHDRFAGVTYWAEQARRQLP